MFVDTFMGGGIVLPSVQCSFLRGTTFSRMAPCSAAEAAEQGLCPWPRGGAGQWAGSGPALVTQVGTVPWGLDTLSRLSITPG